MSKILSSKTCMYVFELIFTSEDSWNIPHFGIPPYMGFPFSSIDNIGVSSILSSPPKLYSFGSLLLENLYESCNWYMLLVKLSLKFPKRGGVICERQSC